MSLPDSREALAAMTDEEILARYRQRDPSIPLSGAKRYRREELNWWHLTAQVRVRELEEHQRAGNNEC